MQAKVSIRMTLAKKSKDRAPLSKNILSNVVLVNESRDSVHQIVSLSYDPIVGLVSAQLYPRSVRPVLRSSLCNLSEFNDQVLGQRFQLLA